MRRDPFVVIVLAVLGACCGISAFLDGYYDLRVWGWIELGLMVLLFGVVLSRPAPRRLVPLLALAGLALMAAWALTSALWGESADQAVLEGNRLVAYAVLFALLLFLIRSEALGAVAVAAWTAGISIMAAWLFFRLLQGGAGDLFIYRRLSVPLDYSNGLASYLMLGLWPIVAVAERGRHWGAAGGAAAGASLLISLIFLTASRGAAVTLVATAVVVLALVPGRIGRAWLLLVLLAGLAVAGPSLAEVNRVGTQVEDINAAALLALAVGAAVGVVWGLVVAVATGRLAAFPAARAHRAARIGLVVVAAAAVVAAVVFSGRLVDEVKSRYDSFQTPRSPVATDAPNRLLSASDSRSDHWRIAWGDFKANPVQGVGAGNFDRSYFLKRTTDVTVRQPHSIEFQTLAELGLVGLLTLALFAGAVLAGLVRRARAVARSGRGVALTVAVTGAFVAWLLHTSLDWMHLMPGLTGIALAAAATLVRRPDDGAGEARERRLPPAGVAVVGVVLLIGAFFVIRPLMAERELAAGRAALGDEPAAALRHASRALAFNSQSVPAYHLRAAGWARVGDYGRSRAALGAATRLEPSDFATWTLLGDLAVQRGDLTLARAAYGRALRLNPRDSALRALVRDPRQGAR